MPPSTTRAALRQRLLRRIDFPAHPLTSATTLIGTTTALNDTILAPSAQLEDYIGAWVYIAEAVGSGPAVGEIARVTNVNFSGTNSQFTLAPALSLAIQTGTDYEIHRRFHPAVLHQVIADVLDELEHPILLPLTLITDGDMETSGVTDWTASNATLVKSVTTVLRGRQALSVTATAANGQARSAAVNLPPKTEVFCAADVFITGGDSAKLILQGGTSGEIETAQSAATGWVHLEFETATKATDETAHLRLESQANTDVTIWDNAVLLPRLQASLPYPPTIEFSDEIVNVFYFPRGTALENTTDDMAYRLLEGIATFWSHAHVERDETAVVPYRLELEKTPINRMLFVEGRVDFSPFSGATEAILDVATTLAPKELVVELAYAKMLDQMANAARDEGDFNRYNALRAQAAEVRIGVTDYARPYISNRAIVFGALR